MGLGFDEASWIPTALNMSMMFSGVFCIFLNALYGTRRILLTTAAIFGLVSIVLPFSPNLGTTLALQIIAGIASGTFYSLTLTFVLTALPKRLIIFGIAAQQSVPKLFLAGIVPGLLIGAAFMAARVLAAKAAAAFLYCGMA